MISYQQLQNQIQKFFVLLVGILLLFMPVSFAEQLSYSISERQNLEENQAEINNSKVVSEFVINVSENGSITILDSDIYSTEVNSNEIIIQDDNNCFGANSLSLGILYYAYINPSGDVDWHKWNLPSSGKFTVNVDVPSTRDYDIEVYTNCFFGSPVCTSINGKGSSEACTVNANSGDIYTKVKGYLGDYSTSQPYYIKGTFASNSYNLVPGDFTVTPSSPGNADSISVRYRATNLGSDSITSSFNYKLYIDNVHRQTCSSSGASAGTTSYCELSGISLTAGTHKIKNIVDADSQISETNENDNIREQDLSVRDVTSVDLIPGDFTITPSSPTDADSIIVRYRVTNLGPASISGYFNYKFYIDNTLYQTCNANNGISSGSTQYCERSDIRLSRGTHTLKNVVDADSNIAETNEGNNVKTQSLYVSRVDLVPGTFAITPSSPGNADSITVRYRADSLGPDDITKSFNYKLYIDNVHKQTCNSNGAPAGTTSYCELSSISLTSGTHKIKNIVDADSQISETNENDNIKEQDLFVRDVTSVDLMPGHFTITPSSPTEANSISVEYTVENNGPADVTSYFNLKLYIDDVLHQTCDVNNGLRSGYIGYCVRSGITLTPGTHILKNIVDQSNLIAETNEGNNIKTQNLNVLSSCPADKPYKYDGTCHLCQQGYLECGGLCYNKQNSCSFGEPFCGYDNNAYCCSSTYQYSCPAANTCFTSPSYCDGRTVYNCQGSTWVCLDKTAVGTCVGTTLKCCPSGYPYYWESDNRCHTSPQQQVTCNIPDGSSSECDCDSNSECPSTYPYCQDNYPSPISDGYDACLSSQPQYCGNGLCLSGESYLNCPQDCTAPKGTINVNVYQSSNNNPISGAYVSYDNVPQGTTDSSGKKIFEAGFGQRNVKVECPDNTYCNTKTVNVDGAEYVGFGCNCNPLGDSDGDGYKDEDELLLGTDPNNRNENLATVFSPLNFDYPKSCLDLPSILTVVWNNRDNLIQGHEILVQSLNITSVTSSNLEDNPKEAIKVLLTSQINGKIITENSTTLMAAIGTSEKIGYLETDYGVILTITDYETSSTAVIQIGAVCVGTFIGNLYGAGTGVKDDIVGIGAILQGIWHLATNTQKTVSEITDFMRGIPSLWGNAGTIFIDMITGILEKGRVLNIFREGRFNNAESYLAFQMGFTTGFIQGYIAEQIIAAVTGIGTVWKMLRGGELLGKVGKSAKLASFLTYLTEKFGGEFATAVKSFKYADKIMDWTEAERNALVKIARLGRAIWLDELTEAEARLALKHVDSLSTVRKIADSDIDKLLSTNIGRNTLKLADATDDLLVKQIKLANNWGINELEKVASRYDGYWWWQKTGWMKVNRLLDNIPTNVVEKLKPDAAIKFLGDSQFMEAITRVLKLSDSFSSSFKSLDEIENAVKNGLTSPGTKKVYENSVSGASATTRSQNAASFANFEKELGAVFKKSELDIEAVVGKANPKGADYVVEIDNIVTGVSVKSAKDVTVFSKISDNMLIGAQDLVDVKKSTGLWENHILHISVKSNDYANAIKYTDSFFKDPQKISQLNNIMGSDNFKVIISQVDEYLIN